MGFFDTGESNCGKCKLAEGCQTPGLSYGGQGNKKILVITEGPSKQEDINGAIAFTPADNIYTRVLSLQGIDPQRDCWKTVATRCYKDGAPSSVEIKACSVHLRKLVRSLAPEKIIVFGKTALQALIGDKMTTTAFTKWVGWRIPDVDFNTTIYPIYSPGYVKANCRELNSAEPLYKHFVKLVGDAVEHQPEKQKLFFKGFYNQIENLKKITSGIWAFDFETTGLKPHAPGHEVVCVSFSDGRKNLCIKITEEVKGELQRIFTCPDIKLIAHNMKFEDAWAREVLGIQITNWYWDTMLAAHCLDNRSGITGLKFQTYVNFGVAGYEKDVSDFLRSTEDGANGFNRVREAPEKSLQWYCALDSFYTFHLFSKQFDKVPPGFFFFLEGAKELSVVESNGICLDVARVKKQRALLRKKIDADWQELQDNPDIIKWQEENEKTLNFNSPPQMRSFFRGVGEKFVKQTAKGADSTDKESLNGFRHPVAKMILAIRANEKLEGTFLRGLEVEQVDGILHPFYNLGVATTYRSSSSNPNAQNWPKRDKRSQRIIRGNFKPRPGRLLLEADFKGVEVCVSACYHKDKNMIRYIEDPTTDMHRDVAALLFKVPPEEVTKEMRYFGKNGFVFPQFYGSWYKQCADNIWKDMPKAMKVGLRGKGIKTLLQFQNHVKHIENHFWNIRFREYAAWKRRQWQDYLRNGEIRSHTGFVYTGVMNKKEVSNYPIQGSAFHCLLWCLIQINRWLRKRKMKSLIVNQIHDSIIFDIVPEELESIKKRINRIMCVDLQAHWDWINVPLAVEIETSEIDGSWFEMKEEKI